MDNRSSSHTSRRIWLQQAGALSLGATSLSGLLGPGGVAHAQQAQATSLVLGDQAGGLRALFEASRTLEGVGFNWHHGAANRGRPVGPRRDLVRAGGRGGHHACAGVARGCTKGGTLF
ncbi:hypothetical protein CLU85_2678 [Acidovorax sp. 69]|uniref:hypothetical protein n=1 Tax=Acidovorax sp. 69 TaxID=2035202 RepID=UPI000CC751B8|nr:hypothetical protein [Acidovorax sp. 69]PJI97878.1 hypothetical protein CLU85_2678 [Acidovorax sp. 69]